MNDILNVFQKPLYDESIVKKEYHSYSSYLNSFKNNDEIRISIQNQDLYVLPSESMLYIEGAVTLNDDSISHSLKLKNNCIAYLFEEIRYEMNGMEIDHTRYTGITSTMKALASVSPIESNMLLNAGWSNAEEISTKSGQFNFCLPLKMLLGFAEDYNKVVFNAKHELILLRSKSDKSVAYSSKDEEKDKLKLQINTITWKVPHIQLADFAKLQLFKSIKSGQPITMAFRTWDCHLNPTLAQGTNHLWNVKLASQNERPRFMLIGFLNNDNFVHNSLTNIKVHLNSESYPYDDLNLKFDNDRYALLYNMYSKFQQSYYMKDPQPLLNIYEFKKQPLIVIDLSHQNETVKSGPIDVRIEFKTLKNVPENTSAYCLIIHDRIIQYTPITGEIRKIV